MMSETFLSCKHFHSRELALDGPCSTALGSGFSLRASEFRMTKTVKLLRELIARPSVNPAFVAEGDEHAGESQVADFVADTAAKAGLEIEFQPVFDGRANVLARYSPPGPIECRLLLAPHMDTVGGPEIPGSLFTPRLKGNRLFGRGACDTKGSIAAMLSALIAVSNNPGRPRRTEITLAALVDEESAQAGSRALLKHKIRPDLAIVGEPTMLNLVTAHKGVLWLELQTLGKAAHGARPELGQNAVHEMARVVDFLQTTYTADLKKLRHPLLGHATINVGAIRGGSQPNIVPAECVALVDRRLMPGETSSKAIEQIKTALRKKGLSPRIRRFQAGECHALETDPRQHLVRQFLHAIDQHKSFGVDYFSDAGILADAHIPSVLFGPGDIAQAHTPDEWIDVRQVDRAVELLIKFLRTLP